MLPLPLPVAGGSIDELTGQRALVLTHYLVAQLAGKSGRGAQLRRVVQDM